MSPASHSIPRMKHPTHAAAVSGEPVGSSGGRRRHGWELAVGVTEQVIGIALRLDMRASPPDVSGAVMVIWQATMSRRFQLRCDGRHDRAKLST
jgi:hypothetical protein